MQRAKRVCVWLGALSVGLPAVVGAQTFEAGVKVGVAITGVPHAGEVFDQVAGLPSNESSSRLGLTGGGYVRFPITDRFGFQPEALFVMKGVELYQAATGGTLSARVNYLDIPLLMRFRVSSTASTDPTMVGYVLAGPSFGIKVSDSAKLDAPGNTKDLNVDSALKSLDLGLAFGGGVEFKNYLVEGRFTAGLTDVASTTYTHPDSLRNRTFSVLFGIKIR
jgi:hypothetical protein